MLGNICNKYIFQRAIFNITEAFKIEFLLT